MAQSICLSCAILAGQAPTLGGAIVETRHFHAHQDLAYPVVGQIIVAARKHFTALTDMTEKETAEFLPLLQRLRKAQAHALGIEHVYYIYSEDTTHHFHVWMVPRHEWMTRFGRSIEGVRPALLHAREHMSSLVEIEAVRQAVVALKDALE